MSNLNGDAYSRALQTVGGLDKEIAIELFRPTASSSEKYFGLPVTSNDNDVANWDYPFFGLCRFILSEDISPELFELFALLAFITNDTDCESFKTESYRHKGMTKLPLNPSLSFAGRIAQIWNHSTEKEKRLLLNGWRQLTADLKTFVTYRCFPLSSSYSCEKAADPLRQPDFFKILEDELLIRRAIPVGTSVLHKRIRNEDWFWFVLCARNGKVCLSCCSQPGVVVYNRKHGLLRTSNIKRDVHHLSCIIHSFSKAFFGEGQAFVTMNKKLMKHFNLWGVQRLAGERPESGRPELDSLTHDTYDAAGKVAVIGTNASSVKKMNEAEEVGYVHSAQFNMSMHDDNERVCRKQFTAHSGNMLTVERGSEESAIIDLLAKYKLMKTGAERDHDPVPCGDIAKRVTWMGKSDLLDQPCALWQFKELFGCHFSKIEKYLLPAKHAKPTSHYREQNGASMTIVGGLAEGIALWEGRVHETDYLSVEKEELKPYTLTLAGQAIAKTLTEEKPPASPRASGRKRRGENTDNSDREAYFLEIEKQMTKGQSCNAACAAVRRKHKLIIETESLAHAYRLWKKKHR